MTAKQVAFLQSMLEQSTISKAAEAAGISRETAYRYLKDPSFQAELSKRQGECINNTVRFLQGKLAFCSETLIQIVENPEAADQVKINAINAVFANCKAMIEAAANIEALERLARIEKQMEEMGEQ